MAREETHAQFAERLRRKRTRSSRIETPSFALSQDEVVKKYMLALGAGTYALAKAMLFELQALVHPGPLHLLKVQSVGPNHIEFAYLTGRDATIVLRLNGAVWVAELSTPRISHVSGSPQRGVQGFREWLQAVAKYL